MTCLANNRSAVFDCLDLVEFDGDRIVRFHHNLDTAALAALLGP